MRHAETALWLLLALATLPAAAPARADEPAWRHAAPITVQQPAAYLRLAVPPAAYARSEQAALADLRIVDADGATVPHAVLPPLRTEAAPSLRPVALYPLPPRRTPDAALGTPVEVVVQGDRITVRQPGAAPAVAGAAPPGWLFDLGEPVQPATPGAARPAPRVLRLQWSAGADFSAAYELQTSDRLAAWQPAGGGQLLQLQGAGGPLLQQEVALPAGVPRFVRLVWADAAAAPRLAAATAVTVPDEPAHGDATTTLNIAAGSEPAGKAPAPPGSLHYDLGGVMPVAALALQLPAGTRVAPVRVQGRSRADGPWQDLGATVFYRLERTGAAGNPPPWPLQATVRYLRLLPDPRSAAPDPAMSPLAVQVRLATLVFPMQGRPPYRLLAGSTSATPGALPVDTLVPQLDEERARMGRAELGSFAENAEAARQAATAARQAALRPWLLWGVLLAGVAGLGAMVWKLARSRPAA